MLFVDHDEAQVRELHAVLDQRMRADEYVKSLYGNVDMKGASDEIKKVRADFIAAQTMEIVDPISITTELTTLEKEINDFVVEIDSALSVSNALTELEITY